ncbi:MAG: bifunctional 2-C-methyl-D-erythritol 4-phosphate cytidylyltransferase/2-C-methyl-D-erythritol 2,4-cyclodiphosphate synthase [Alphaproteobacteria bacterium]
MAECIALIVAAGRGSRLGAEIPKQYLRLDGRSLLAHAAAALTAHPAVGAARVVIRDTDRTLYRDAVAGLDLLDPVPGGADRQESVRLGLESLTGMAPERVLIHDAARPFVADAVIDRLLAALDSHAGAVPALPVADSLKRGAAGRVTEDLARDGLWRAQTPQAFRYPDILAAHRAAAGAALTDDAAVAARSGLDVAIVEGDRASFKVTTDGDLRFALALAGETRPGETRIGNGLDVHAFGGGDHVMLCGVRIPHDRGLRGHSDADVGLHALTDALLGAIGEGDIGDRFPPGDPRWRDADSSIFLAHAGARIAARGGAIVNLDVTFICERPRIAPHRAAMRARIAEILAIAPGRVSVKATTTEGLGFTGRDEGIAAQATATVRLPADDGAGMRA